MDERDLVRHASFLRLLARGLLGDEHLAEDAVQDAYVAAIEARAVRNPGGWLAAVTRNLALRIRRREGGRRRVERSFARREGLPSAAELAAQAEAQRRVAQAVLELDEPYRAAVLLRFFQGWTPTEIARRTGEPLATVKTRLRRALQALRARLDAENGGRREAWALALLPLAGRGRDTLAATLGGLAMLKTKVLAAGAVLALLATLLLTAPLLPREAGDAPRAAPTPAAPADTVAAATPEPPAPAEAAAALDAARAALEAVSAGERQSYEQWRRVMPIAASGRAIARNAAKLFAEHRQEEAEAPATPDATTRAYLAELAAKYRGLPAGADRLAVLTTFLEVHHDYLVRTRDASFLAFLEEVARGSDVAEERVAAVPSGPEHGALDLLLRLADHPDDAVRAAAVRGLGEAEGEPRALRWILDGLEDGSSLVRWTAALELEFVVADPAHAGAILDRIPRERHPLAMDGMVKAVLSLDPARGADRIDAALAGAPPEVRALATRPVAPAQPSPAPAPAKAAPSKRPEPEPDESGRRYLEQLLADYRALPQGDARLSALETFAKRHRFFLERTGDAMFIPVLREIALGAAVEEERVAVVRSLKAAMDPRAVDLLVALKESPDATVRQAVATSLAWARGAEATRAHAELLTLLEDPAVGVRRVAAMLVGTPVSDPANLPRLLSTLSREADFSVAWALVRSILDLDPEGGRARIEGLVPASGAAATAIRDALAAQAKR